MHAQQSYWYGIELRPRDGLSVRQQALVKPATPPSLYLRHATASAFRLLVSISQYLIVSSLKFQIFYPLYCAGRARSILVMYLNPLTEPRRGRK
jgi:hypothetical protein